jgi:hypothetical protein
VGFQDPLDRRHADVGQIDWPHEHRAGVHRLQGAQSLSEGGDGPGFRLRILHDHAVMAGKSGLDPGRVESKDDDSSFYLERFQSLQDSDDERETKEIQQGFGRAHSGRPASREHDAR